MFQMNKRHMKKVLLILLILLPLKIYAQEKPSKDADSVVVTAICVEPANIVKDIPQEIEYIRVYTQYRKPKTAAEKARYGDNRYLCPNAIRFEDSTTLSILQKQMKKVEKRLKRIPVDNIDFVGFELVSVYNEQDDFASQRASAVVKSYGFHDYARRDSPVYLYKRVQPK